MAPRDLQLHRYGSAAEFAEATAGYLETREAAHCLLIGLAHELRRTPRLYGFDPYLASVTRGERIVAVALRTPPHDLQLSELTDGDAVEIILEDVLVEYPDLAGVMGPTAPAGRFAERWADRSGRPRRLAMALRVFEAEQASLPTDVPGQMRRPRSDERPTLVAWLDAFVEEANPEHREQTPDEMVAGYERLGGDLGIYVWDADGRAVSVAACTGPTPSGVRIGAVYTPPALRGRGYASALTGTLTRTLLDGGRRFCFLLTDLANPTSNRIYLRLGYRPVTDLAEYRFD